MCRSAMVSVLYREVFANVGDMKKRLTKGCPSSGTGKWKEGQNALHLLVCVCLNSRNRYYRVHIDIEHRVRVLVCFPSYSCNFTRLK